jgi:hypothetical protein
MGGKPWRGLDPTTSSIEVADERGKPVLKVPFREALQPIPAPATRAFLQSSNRFENCSERQQQRDLRHEKHRGE